MDLISREAIKKMLSDSIDKYNEELFEMTGTREDIDNFSRINSRLVEDKEISVEVSQLPSAFEGMTNGEVIEALFPNIVEYNRDEYHSTLAIRGEGKDIVLPISFLDSPYKGVSE